MHHPPLGWFHLDPTFYGRIAGGVRGTLLVNSLYVHIVDKSLQSIWDILISYRVGQRNPEKNIWWYLYQIYILEITSNWTFYDHFHVRLLDILFQFEHPNPNEIVEPCVKPLVRTCSPFSIRSVRYLLEVFSQSGVTYQRMFIGPNSFCATPIMVHDIHSKRARGPDILISQQLEVPLMEHRLS